MKACTRCREVKDLSLFRANPKMRDGADSWCRACVAQHKSAVRQDIYRADKTVPAAKACGDCRQQLAAERFAVERGRKDGLARICKECRSAKHRRAYAKDPEAWKAKALKGYHERKVNPSFVVHRRVSARITEWLGTKKGGRRCFDLLGYTLPELREHLERQFLPGMGWANVGDWHIDHIVPLSAFEVDGPEHPDFRRAWALTNLRPLWAKDNISKGARRVSLL